jgi:phosphonate transport system substrate-binding protein
VALASNTDAHPRQLQGKAVALANPQSLVAMVGVKWLEEQGLKLGKDFKTVLTANDDSLGTVLNTGEAPLAIMSLGEFNAKPEAMRKTLRIVTEITKLPGFLVMANPRLPAAEKQRLKQLVLAFPQTEEGKAFFTLSGFKNIRDVSEAELKPLDDVVNDTRKGLAGG